MVKLLISTAVAAAAMAVASPAAAQYYPQPNYGYNDDRGYNSGNWGSIRSYQTRVDRLRHEIRQLDRRNILSESEARRLDDEARRLRRDIQLAGFNGFSRSERYELDRRLQNLRLLIRREASDGNRYGDRRFDTYNDGRWQDPYGRWNDASDTRWQDREGKWHDKHEKWHDRNERKQEREHDRSGYYGNDRHDDD